MFNLVCMCMQAGPRAVPDSGPDLIRRRVSDFAAELELPAIPVHHSSSWYNATELPINNFLLFVCLQSPRRPSDVSSIDTLTSATRVESHHNSLMFFDRGKKCM